MRKRQADISLEQTLKDRDVEEKIDLLFYRRVGFRLALLARRLGITPNALTITGISIGIVAGHFFYYESLAINLLGMLLWVICNIFDSADGQLARMTGSTSELGRILDGLGGSFVFFSMYVHICFRYVEGGGSLGWWILPVAVLAGFFHSVQSAMADYFRNAYLRYGARESKGELTTAAAVEREYRSVSWSRNPLRKLSLRIYLNYTRQQEYFSPAFQRFRAYVESTWNGDPPADFRQRYREVNRPLLKYFNYLTINGRVLTLFAFVALGIPAYFFPLEIVGMTILLVIVMRTQERRISRLHEAARRDDDDRIHEVGLQGAGI